VFGKVLIANRGEIAVRVVRACRELGISSVVAYSTADADSLAVRLADEAVSVGPPQAKGSYLHIPNLVGAALKAGADAVHPGYGFLSEDVDFAEVCEDNGVTFIGPRPEVTSRIGDKALARRLMGEAGLPLLPGSHSTVSGPAEAGEVAAEIGYPVIIKAAAGGGGRGMAVVTDPALLRETVERTQAAARAVFGDPAVYVERYLPAARHVEVQVVCDNHGSAVHLGERDCSVQRRHQKLVEEAPSAHLSPERRAEIGAAAVAGLRSIGYTGVGTMEFLVDDQGNATFMEVNGRIQVEHPVTEMVTGIDLVAEQLRVAAGHPLSFKQDEVVLAGAAIECRLNAEDPDREFRPTPGRLEVCALPGGPWTRVDAGFETGSVVPPYYDSLIAKLIVWAPDRQRAIARMERALAEVRISGSGIRTTAGFLREVLADPAFRDGEHTTGFVDDLLRRRGG
jgi:acetyl-CoA carboxylase, biotin carboxylase subunit